MTKFIIKTGFFSAIFLLFTFSHSVFASIHYSRDNRAITYSYDNLQDLSDNVSGDGCPSDIDISWKWAFWLYDENTQSGTIVNTQPITVNPLTYIVPDNMEVTQIESAIDPIDPANELCGHVLEPVYLKSIAPTPTPVIVNVTTVITKPITPTPTPTPVPDTTKPVVTVSTNFSKSFESTPEITGIAKDNKDVDKVEYSLDGGKNWLLVDNMGSKGKQSTTFSFIPSVSDDGNYPLQVRAIDLGRNIGFSKKYILVIDRLPPQASGVLFSMGPQVLNPTDDGNILVTKGQNFKISISDIGGATSMDIFADDLKGYSKKFSLTKNSESGLWSANISLGKEAEYQLRYSAIDGAGNKTDRNLNKVRLVSQGKINAPNAKITVYFLDKNTNEWKIWDGSYYRQKNPVKSDEKGNYGLFLPIGKYYLQIEAYGFQTQTTQAFDIKNAGPINADFNLVPLRLLLDLRFIKLYWPDFSQLTVSFKNNLPQISSTINQLVGKQLPFFVVDGFQSDSLTGKPSILTFLNTWSPSSSEQIPVLDNFSKNKDFNSVIIVEGEKSSKILIFEKRGSYNLPMYTDPDATLVTAYKLNVLPKSYFIDRKGIITDVVYGVLSEKEIIDILSK